MRRKGIDRRTVLSASFVATQARVTGGGVAPANLITDVTGLRVGHADDRKALTGVTVILANGPMAAAVDVRGGGPGTRETEALALHNLVGAADAIVLSGGSVYGLAAADGVTTWLGQRGRGFALSSHLSAPPSPIVPAAVLFDLDNGGDKSWGDLPPYRDLGVVAIRAASDRFALGAVGAGIGARAGRLRGGLGSASIRSPEGFVVGAIVAVNSFGSVVAADGRTYWATPWEVNGEFGGRSAGGLVADPAGLGLSKRLSAQGQNTTLACVATDASLSPPELERVAMMAQDGLARAVRPAHTPFDGDTVFAVATGAKKVTGDRAFLTARIGALAADTLARAIARGVFEAN